MELQQQLMEFVYGLLDEDEANALSERITSEPDVARAYAKVKLQCDQVGRAAKIDAPTVAWVRPDGTRSAEHKPQLASGSTSRSMTRRLSNWSIGVAASALVCLVATSFLMTQSATDTSPETVMVASAAPVKVVVTGPSKLHAEADNPFTVRVANEAGTPVSTTLNYAVYDTNGGVQWSKSSATDSDGVVRFGIDPSVADGASRLEVTTDSSSTVVLQRDLASTPERYMTYLRTDRPLYQPGESLRFRSVTLSQLALQADRDLTTSFRVVDANDQELAGASSAVVTEQGVGSGEVALPDDLADGEYTLIANSPNDRFREEWRDFQVKKFTAPRLKKTLELAKDSYTAGEQVDADFFVEQVAGKKLVDVPLKYEATLDGIAIVTADAKTDAEGRSSISVKLPDTIERGEANLSVTVQDDSGAAETITKNIPINLGTVNVDFFPEGGDLAADLPSRVYFYGRDPLGKPVHVEGTVVDSVDSHVARVVTTHEGRGSFSFVPAATERYRLKIDKPVGVTKQVAIPVALDDCFATLSTGTGVYEANADVRFALHQRLPAKPMNVAAYCRGVMVAQQPISPGAFVEQDGYVRFDGTLELPAEAQGVIRLTAFDASFDPPTPIAERLVYRRVGRRLNVEIAADSDGFSPGQAVQLDAVVRDEVDSPVPAVLGISIVDDAVLNLADDKSTRMPTYFHLLTQIDSVHRFEDANFYLSDDPDANAALDSLLGTQGWRRFERVSGMMLAGSNKAGSFGGMGGGGFGGGGSMSFEQSGQGLGKRAMTWFDEVSVPVSTTSWFEPIEKIASDQLGRTHRKSRRTMSSFRTPIIVSSVLLLLLIGATSVVPNAGNRSLRVAGFALALGCLAIGVLSLPSVLPTAGNFAIKSSVEASSDSYEYVEADDAVMLDDMADAVGAPEDGQEAAAELVVPDTEAPARRLAAAKEQAPDGLEPAAEPAAAMEAAVAADDNFAAPAEQFPRKAKAGERKLRAATSEAIDKKSLAMPKDAPSLPMAPAEPATAQPFAEGLAGNSLMLQDRQIRGRDEDQAGTPMRRYAARFYDKLHGNVATDQQSSTIFWLPKFVADDNGKATVYFNLPERTGSFRVVVEAHGNGRLGAGEMLIDSR